MKDQEIITGDEDGGVGDAVAPAKLKIDPQGAQPGKYGPFYTLCDILVGEDGAAYVMLSESPIADGHIYKLDGATNKMVMTRPDGHSVPGIPLHRG